MCEIWKGENLFCFCIQKVFLQQMFSLFKKSLYTNPKMMPQYEKKTQEILGCLQPSHISLFYSLFLSNQIALFF